LAALFGPRGGQDAGRLIVAIVADHNLAHLQLLRCHRPGGWRPRIELAGREHVTRALEAGRGAILWVSPSSCAGLATKMAFAREGFEVSHLSREQHGLSASRLGMRLLNPILTSVEERYLKERLVMSDGDSARALLALVDRVRSNRLVSITVAPMGRRTHAVPLGSGALWLAEGAPVLALRSGAALLPVFTMRTAADAFTTVVEPPLTAAPDLDRNAAVRALLAAYAGVLERYLERWTDQFAVLESITLVDPSRSGPSPAAPPPDAADRRAGVPP
jgi:lauroyl/myristoyl acyltransferase